MRFKTSKDKYDYLCEKFNYKFTKKYLEDKYIKDQWSLVDFKNHFGIDYKATMFLLEYFNIPKRDSRAAAKSKRTRNKYKKTCKNKYNVDNVSKLESIKQKKKDTFKENYGVDNIWKSSAYYNWLHDHMLEKYGKKSLPNKYGNMQKYWDDINQDDKDKHMKSAQKAWSEAWDNMSDDQKNALIAKRKNSWWKTIKKNGFDNYYKSKLESRVASSLLRLGIAFETQRFINKKSYDFVISKTKIIIEVNGDYWHANPQFYKTGDLISYPGKKLYAQDIWNKDQNKLDNAKKYGYNVILLWEQDIINLTDDKLDMLVSDKINENGKIKINQKSKKSK